MKGWDDGLEVVGMAELVDKSLTPLGFLHDSLLVILTKRARELVIVHGWSILSLAPESGHLDWVNDLEDSLLSVNPVDVVTIGLGLQQELLHELPEMNVGARSGSRSWRLVTRLRFLLLIIILLLHVLHTKVAAAGWSWSHWRCWWCCWMRIGWWRHAWLRLGSHILRCLLLLLLLSVVAVQHLQHVSDVSVVVVRAGGSVSGLRPVLLVRWRRIVVPGVGVAGVVGAPDVELSEQILSVSVSVATGQAVLEVSLVHLHQRGTVHHVPVIQIQQRHGNWELLESQQQPGLGGLSTPISRI